VSTTGKGCLCIRKGCFAARKGCLSFSSENQGPDSFGGFKELSGIKSRIRV
jgi:hypothetical protein